MSEDDSSDNARDNARDDAGGDTKKAPASRSHAPETVITEAGRDPFAHHGIVNPPVYHASTVLFPDLAALEAADRRPFDGVFYGRNGTPTTFALEEAMARLEGADRAVATASGLAAITGTLLALLNRGDHLLMVDSVYSPSRKLAGNLLEGFGIETTFYDPGLDSKGLRAMIRPETRVVLAESPGSLTFEVQDIPALCAVAHEAGALVVMDNSWATPLYFRPLDHGVDISIQAATKYIVGHSDVMMGTIATSEALFRRIRPRLGLLGAVPGPDDCYLTLRGLRTLAVRLARHQETGLCLARWLSRRKEVARVLHPALPDCPGHAFWLRDFTGASGLFSIILSKPYDRKAIAAMVDSMRLFRIGYSWGGYESLILPCDPRPIRSARPWREEGPVIRLHAGLEAAEDLLADLEDGLARLEASC